MSKSRIPRLKPHLLLLLITTLLFVLQPVYSKTVDESTRLKSPLQDPEPIQFVENVLQENDSQDYCNVC